ncbi:MAG: Ppx/GppA family phosphatase [Clostridia bacterium]|nr:Ppx/GppA family phosphatase [Clostridia bacterium]
MQKVAVIGIGSNSVRMLVAEVEEDGFTRLTRDREGTRLFAGLDEKGNLSPESMEKTATAVERMAISAGKIGCDKLHIFATSASRDARNGQVFLSLLREKTGVEPEIITGEEEAVLSFLGATDVAARGERCGVIDIGGGSTELVIGQGARIDLAISCQMGAVRLYRLLAINGKEDMPAVEYAAGEILREKWNTIQAPSVPGKWIGTGGTFTALAALSKGVHWTDRTYMHGYCLKKEKIRQIGETLAGMTPEQRLQLEGLQPSRADIVVHGICILLAVMSHLGAEEILVSEYGNLDGFLRKHYFESI